MKRLPDSTESNFGFGYCYHRMIENNVNSANLRVTKELIIQDIIQLLSIRSYSASAASQSSDDFHSCRDLLLTNTHQIIIDYWQMFCNFDRLSQ